MRAAKTARINEVLPIADGGSSAALGDIVDAGATRLLLFGPIVAALSFIFAE